MNNHLKRLYTLKKISIKIIFLTISEKFLYGKNYEIFLGKYFLSGKAYEAKRVIRYPEFDKNKGHYGKQEPFDIGLIELKESVYNKNSGDYRYIKPICLPEKNIKNNRSEPAFISGWGKKNSESYGKLKISNTFLDSGNILIEFEKVRVCLVSFFPDYFY